jgi:hypothetical protein
MSHPAVDDEIFSVDTVTGWLVCSDDDEFVDDELDDLKEFTPIAVDIDVELDDEKDSLIPVAFLPLPVR